MFELLLIFALTCPAPVSPFDNLPRKFPIDMIVPSPDEMFIMNQYGQGCFVINSGGEDRNICTPGQLVSIIKPFLIFGVGIKFIFS